MCLIVELLMFIKYMLDISAKVYNKLEYYNLILLFFIFLALLSRKIKKNIYIRKINVFVNFN